MPMTYAQMILTCPAQHTWTIFGILDRNGTLIVADFDPDDPELAAKIEEVERTMGHCPTCGKEPIDSTLSGVSTQYIADQAH